MSNQPKLFFPSQRLDADPHDTGRQHLCVPGMLSKASLLQPEVPFSRDSVEPAAALSSHTTWSFEVEKKSASDIYSDSDQHRSPRSPVVGHELCLVDPDSFHQTVWESASQCLQLLPVKFLGGILGLPTFPTLSKIILLKNLTGDTLQVLFNHFSNLQMSK